MDASNDIRDLVVAARQGEPDAVGRLFETARVHLLRLADRELPAEVRAKLGPSDVVQETALDMQRSFGQFTGETAEELFAWLRGILRNNVVDAVRRYRDALKRDAAREWSLGASGVRRAGDGIAGVTHPADDSAIRREEAATLNRVLARLSDDHQRVLRMRYWDGLKFHEIAPHLGRSPDAVRKLWYRALERLQVELGAAAAPAPPTEAH